MNIYSNKFEGSLLWCDDLPAGMLHLDIAATDSNIDELYESIISETGNRDQAWNKLWDHEKIDDCYVWISETDPQRAIDLKLGEVEWDENGFEFPEWFTEIAIQQYVMLAEYNTAHNLAITDLDDVGYSLYKKFRLMIDNGNQYLRLKHQGPYNPDNKKTILFASGITEENLTGAWNQVDFDESENMFDICKKLGVDYPFQWLFERKSRIEYQYKISVNPFEDTVRAMNQAVSDIDKQIADLQKKRADLLPKIAEAVSERDRVVKIATAHKNELLNK